MNADKEKYLKQENKQLELSKLDGIEDYNANYMAGYRHGYERAYNDVLSKIESISRAIEVIDIQKELSLIENDTINNDEKLKFYFKAYNKGCKDTKRNPFEGIGKPEPLKENLKGLWSRRIDKEHRLVYFIDGDSLVILQCKGHYN